MKATEAARATEAGRASLPSRTRATFTSRLSVLMTMIGVAVGLGNVWRFPYMVGEFGGAAFVLVYVFIVVFIGVPGLMAEWMLGRRTRRGPVGAFERAGLPLGKGVGWFFFFVVIAATAYYTAVIGWTLVYGIGQVAGLMFPDWNSSNILPPASGFDLDSYVLGAGCTGLVILACVAILLKGVKSGIESASRVITPILFIALLVVIGRSLTLPGAFEGVRWYILKFELGDVTPTVMVAALGQVTFSLALGGTFMVVYGSYLRAGEDLNRTAMLTALGDTSAGLLAGLAIFPAVFALGLEPSSGPDLLFVALPEIFQSIPGGWFFGLVFFAGLLGVAYLSAVAAFEVLVAGLTDNTRLSRSRAVWLTAFAVFCFSLPPVINMEIFVIWDLTFGSGMQTLGALLAVVTAGWLIRRSEAVKELAIGGEARSAIWLHRWMRYVVPGSLLILAIWWLSTELL